jgi:hypothetical protein
MFGVAAPTKVINLLQLVAVNYYKADLSVLLVVWVFA